MDIRMPKEIRKYKEKFYFNLNLRQTVCCILAIIINVPIYWYGRRYIGEDLASWVVILNAAPIMLVGFYNYNGMNFEEILVAIIKFEFVYPKKRKYEVMNLIEILINENKKLEKKNKRKYKNIKKIGGEN